jgi:hypothetical protein
LFTTTLAVAIQARIDARRWSSCSIGIASN